MKEFLLIFPFSALFLTILSIVVVSCNESGVSIPPLLEAECREAEGSEENGAMEGTSAGRFAEIYEMYKNPTYDGNTRPLIIAHRTDWLHHPENSLAGIQSFIDMGGDIAEIDIRRTKDKVFILMHDETLNRTTNGGGKVSGKNFYGYINRLYLKEGNGSNDRFTCERVPTLAEALELVRGKIMLNLDKGWDHRDELYALLEEKGMVDHAIFKSAHNAHTVDTWLDSKRLRPNYVQKFKNNREFSSAESFFTSNNAAFPDAFELGYQNEGDTSISTRMRNLLKANGAGIWFNTISAGQGSSAHTDAVSLNNPEEGWGWVIDKDATLIQTDHPQQLIAYLEGAPDSVVPNGWAATDIGVVGAYGSTLYDSDRNTFTLRGSGKDIWKSNDEFHYAYKELPSRGDVTIYARIGPFMERDTFDIKNVHEWAKAGLMMRENLNPGGKYVAVLVSKEHGTTFQMRSTTGTDASKPGGNQHGINAPIYLRLSKFGNNVSVEYTSMFPSESWTTLDIDGPQSISFSGDSFYVGLAVSAHDDGYLHEMVFEDVRVTTY